MSKNCLMNFPYKKWIIVDDGDRQTPGETSEFIWRAKKLLTSYNLESTGIMGVKIPNHFRRGCVLASNVKRSADCNTEKLSTNFFQISLSISGKFRL
jgi:hypothetical protein